MSHDLGNDVSYVYDEEGYNYDMVVFQKGKPPLDTELNVMQQLQDLIDQRQMNFLSSGWLSMYPYHADGLVDNTFYTQNPTNPKPEFALINGNIIYVTNTNTQTNNLNVLDLGTAPSTGNRINGIFLEMWKVLLDPDTSDNKPDPATIIDDLKAIHMYSANLGWIVGENGLVLVTENGGQTWSTKVSNTTQTLNDVFFINSSIGWAVGTNGTILRSSSQGEKWTGLTSPTNENLKCVSAASQLIAWAVGDNGTLLKTTNGITWTALSSPTTTNLRKVHFRDSLVGWIVGENGLIMKTTNGGTNWTTLTSGTTENLNSIYFYDLNYGFAVGENGTILRSSDGSSWTNQSNNIWDGSQYISIDEDLNDVHMVPGLDVKVTNEEVSHLFNGTNKSCTLAHSPVTVGDGKGTITNSPSYVTVKVNGSEVTVDALNGSTGTITLAAAPKVHDTVLVTYYYKSDCEVFEGKAWIVGGSGTILMTDDIGAQWDQQTSGTARDLSGVFFINNMKGWAVGIESVIRYTQNGGLTWSGQDPETVVRQVQRIYKEGNVDTLVFLNDSSIHPDTNVETTKRVQIQYRIRVISGADPQSNPEAGLSSSILAQGPNTSGSFGYENMGAVNGDYGLWRAKCPNTVDGFCYAIPMFFVNRRNTAVYNAQTNANGSHQKNTANVRPDLLTATQIMDSDILDVRRKINIPSVSQYLQSTFDALSSNSLKTRFDRVTTGGDRYGTEILIVDRVAGTTADGGQPISGATLDDAIAGDVSSEVTLVEVAREPAASTVLPTDYTLLGPAGSAGIFHTDPAYFKATYVSPGSAFNDRAIPGYFEGLGTNQVRFIFKSFANTQTEDTNLSAYRIAGMFIQSNSSSLRQIPATPALVENTSGTGGPSFFYHGVLNSVTSKTIETWDSGISGYNNYAIVYPGKNSSNSNQKNRASTVEIHYFMTVSSSNTSGLNTLIVPRDIDVDPTDVPYQIYTISRVNNITSGFVYRIVNLDMQTSATEVRVVSASGFSFISGTIVEVVAHALSSSSSSNVRNGASVNFTASTKKIGTFCRSYLADASSITGPTPGSIIIPITNGLLLGSSTTDMTTSLSQHFAWIDIAGSENIYPVTISGYGDSSAQVNVGTIPAGTGDLTIQLLVEETEFTNPQGSNNGLLIGYTYIPYQSVVALPTTINIKISAPSPFMYVSNLGTGGGTAGSPYNNPIEHIPIGDPTINSNLFSNQVPLQFRNFSIDTGIAQLPYYIPANFGQEITLSVIDQDGQGRTFYSVSSKEFDIATEGLQIPTLRKVYIPAIAQVTSSSDNKLLVGEYIMVIFSRTLDTETENTTGFDADGTDIVAVYRLPNKPISRI